jgi:hypothetical protein
MYDGPNYNPPDVQRHAPGQPPWVQTQAKAMHDAAAWQARRPDGRRVAVTLSRARRFKFALRQRTGVLSALVVAIAAALSFGSVTPAFAGNTPDCGTTSPYLHCYSYTEFDLGGAAQFEGGHGTFPLTNLKSGPSSGANNGASDYHVNNTVWVNFSSTDYIEGGVRDGYVQPNNYNHCGNGSCDSVTYESGSGASQSCISNGCGAYVLYWEDHHNSGGTQYTYMHIVRFLSPTGGNEFVDILWNYSGHNDWDLNFTGAYAYSGQSTIDDGYHHPTSVQVGGELYAPANNGECAAYSADQAGVWETPGWTIIWPETAPGATVTPSTFTSLFGNGFYDSSGDLNWSANTPCT